MKIKDFSFELPDELIAQYPPTVRGGARLLVVNRSTGKLEHTTTADLCNHIAPNAIMVFNDSRVRKARIYGCSRDGGRVELLLTRQIDAFTWEALTSKTRRQKVGKALAFEGGVTATVTSARGIFRTVRFSPAIDDSWLDKYGHIPLPPYIERPDEPSDAERYQTVYNRVTGSIAAPTAGLHFTDELLGALKDREVDLAYITLHVGVGTFSPIREERIEDHVMHGEEYEIGDDCAEKLSRAIADKRPIVAVGTTSVRCLESAYQSGKVLPGRGNTNLYIKPGYRFRVVNTLFTNFHTPDSSLIVLVSAFAGLQLIKKAYSEAVARRYRFFSYGDAMLIQ